MTRSSMLFAAVAAAIAIAGPASSQSTPLGQITTYKAESLRVYNQTGVREPEPRPRSELPVLPATIVSIGDGGRLGVRYGTGVIYLRGMDVDFALNAAGQEAVNCNAVSAGVRQSNTAVAGTRAGGGSSSDCQVRRGQ